MREWNHLESRSVDQVIGAFLLIDRGLFVDLGGYDERFLVYYEDVDLSLRARAKGFCSMYLSTTYAYHVGGGTARKYWAESLFLNRRSRIQYARKHFGAGAVIALTIATLFVEPIVRTINSIALRSRAELCANWQATRRLWASVLTEGIPS